MSIDSTPHSGRDSVCSRPSPPAAEIPCRWCRNREAAEAAETVAEAKARVDQEMRELGLLELHGRIFDKLVANFESVAGREGYRGLGLDECGLVSEWELDELHHKWRAASKAMSRLERERFLKCATDVAASLAHIVAQFGDGSPCKQEA
jgi:hypothetical protein